MVQACRYCGLLDESIRAHHRARRLDPRIVTSVAHTFFLLGDYQRALEWYPPGALFYLDLAVLAASGREAEAAELLGRRSSPGGQFPAMIESLRFSLQGDHAAEPGDRQAGTRSAAGMGSGNQVLPGAAVGPGRSACGRFADHTRPGDGGVFLLDRLAMRSMAAAAFPAAGLSRTSWIEVLRREAEARAAFQAAGGHEVLS